MNLIALISCFCLPSIWAHATPQRVITTSPTLTEMLYDLGGESRLVATVEFSDYPEAAKKIPRIGNFFAPSIERTLLYRPDLVLVDGAARNSQYEVALSRLGIAKEVIEISTLKSFHEESVRITNLLGLEKVPSVYKTEENQPSFSYLGFAWTSPAIVFTSRTFLHALVESVGGKSLVQFKSEQEYLTVSEEWLILQKPDVVFLLIEDDSQKKDFIQFCKRIWRNQMPKVIFLPSRTFARKTETAISEIKKVAMEIHAK